LGEKGGRSVREQGGLTTESRLLEEFFLTGGNITRKE